MNQLLALLNGKGRDANRGAILIVVVFIAWRVTTLDERVAGIERRLNIVATSSVTNGPLSQLAHELTLP